MREDSPVEPCSRKGELRVELAALRQSAHQRGHVRVAIGRASDFFGAGLPYSMFNERLFRRIFAGKAAECMGDPDMPHSYTYADDVARALVTLGARDEAPGQAWHLPTSPAESRSSLTTAASGSRSAMARHRPTPIDQAVAETATWAMARFGQRAAVSVASAAQ